MKYTDPTGYNALDDFVRDMISRGSNYWSASTGYLTLGESELYLMATYSFPSLTGGGGVPHGTGFQGPGLPYMLPEVTVTAKAPERNVNNQDNLKASLIEFRDRIINSNFARFLVKDYYSVSLDGAVVPGFGASVSPVTINILLRGPEKGIFLTHVPSNSLGFRGGFNLSAQQGTFMGNPNNITRNSLYGLTWSLDSDFPLFPLGVWRGYNSYGEPVWRGTSSSLGFSFGISLNRSWANPGLPK